MNRLGLLITLVLACSSRPLRLHPPDGSSTDGALLGGGGASSPPASGDASATAGIVPSVSVSPSDEVCALATDGTVTCWGNDYYPAPAGTFVAVSAGADFACAVRTDKTLFCWGSDSLGDTLPPRGAFTSVSTGWDFACGLRTDGTIACWGNGAHGDTTPPAGTFKSISLAARDDGTDCGIRTDGTIACWGNNACSGTEHPTGAFTSVSVGRGYCPACGVRTDGSLACHQASTVGPSIECTLPPPSGPFTQIYEDYLLKTDGTVVPLCGSSSGLPAGPFISISVGSTIACGVKPDGAIDCWYLS